MDTQAPERLARELKFPRQKLGSLDAAVAADVIAAGGDVAIVVDGDGVICDIAVSSENILIDDADAWLDKPWGDVVSGDSKHKIDEMLRDARSGADVRWREVHHPTGGGEVTTIKYKAVSAGREGRVIAIGRDDRASAALQARLVQAQQEMEREYARLRDAEARYRLLFQISSEAVLIVNAASRRVVEANPAALALIGDADGPLKGKAFSKLFDKTSHDPASALLTIGRSTARAMGSQARLSIGERALGASASLFRQDRAEYFLVRLSPLERDQETPSEANVRLLSLLDRLPDAFVVTDEQLNIIAENSAFLDLVRLPSKEQVRGQSLHAFLGRPGVDRSLLISNLQEHGTVRNFGTVVRNQFDEMEEVEVSAVQAPDPQQPCFGFTIRRVGRRPGDRAATSPELARSVAQLTELIGRVSLKDLVRETTDLVERLCIEAALELTGNNRASAAQVLGLSRQSLYSKLHRFDLGKVGSSGD